MLCHWDFHTMFKYHGLKKPHSNLVNHHHLLLLLLLLLRCRRRRFPLHHPLHHLQGEEEADHHRRHRQHQTSEVEKSQIGFLLKEDLWTYNVVWVD